MATIQREKYCNAVEDLIGQIESWVADRGWVTKRYLKKSRDAEQFPYEIPSLMVQKGPAKVLLDPVAYDIPGGDGVVDVYLMPTYDDMASLHLKDGEWTIHYVFPADPSETHSVVEPQRLPLTPDVINQVLDSIANATPSF